jgi:hypothetical protein
MRNRRLGFAYVEEKEEFENMEIVFEEGGLYSTRPKFPTNQPLALLSVNIQIQTSIRGTLVYLVWEIPIVEYSGRDFFLQVHSGAAALPQNENLKPTKRQE